MSMSFHDLQAAELQYNGSLNTRPVLDSPHPRSKRAENVLTALSVVMWMGSNLGVLLLNKLLLSYWNFKQPVLLTFFHMISGMFFIWGLRGIKLLSIQNIQSVQQLTKVVTLSLVFACAVLCANVSLKFLAVSMNQAIGAATPVFAAVFAFLLQGERESLLTYSTLALVVGGVVVASGVEPSLNVFGAAICFLGAAFRGVRAVMQAMLLKPEEKLDSMSCLAYMAPFASAFMLLLCFILEPSSIGFMMKLPFEDFALVSALLLNCLAAFASNYFNMVVTKRTSALTIQVLGQCKGVISAVVSVLCFHNIVPALGWCGYSVTVVGCLLYGRCKVHSRMQATKHLHKSSAYDLHYPNWSLPTSNIGSPRSPEKEKEQILTGDAGGRRTAPVFRMGAYEETAATKHETMGPGNDDPHGRKGLAVYNTPLAMGVETSHKWGLSSLNRNVQFSVQFTPGGALQVQVAASPAHNIQRASVASQ